MPYNERLTLRHQSSLSSHRTRTDVILLYTILHGLMNSELKSLFVLIDSTIHNLRGHAFKLLIPKPRTDLLKYNYVYIELVHFGILCLHISVNLHRYLYLHRLTFYFNSNT